MSSQCTLLNLSMVVITGRILLLPGCTRSGEDSRAEEIYNLFFLHEWVWKFLKLVWKKFGILYAWLAANPVLSSYLLKLDIEYGYV